MKKWENPDIRNLSIKATYESPTDELISDLSYTATINGVSQKVNQQGVSDGSGPTGQVNWNENTN